MGILDKLLGRKTVKVEIATNRDKGHLNEGFYVIEQAYGASQAQNLFRQAEAGDVKATAEIARCFYGSIENELAFEWLKKAADLGDADSMVMLVDYYQGHFEGFEADQVMADRYMQKAIELGSPRAYMKLADEHYSEDDPQENAIAFGYYLQAAELGDPEGQAEVGLAYLDGIGVGQDAAEAFRWLSMSKDDKHAAYPLAKCYLEGIGTPVDYDKATAALERAVEAKCLEKNAARHKLIGLYAQGFGGTNRASKMAKMRAELEASSKLLDDLASSLLSS